MNRKAQKSAPPGALLWVCLLVLSAEFVLGGRVLTGGESQFRRSTEALSACFAIADFDGDWKPDIATIEVASLSRVEANYSIHLHLSAAREVFFPVTGPNGGVRVAARDVNGDSLPDLVVSSVSDRRVVAVLLNQGHGKFSRAEPGSYLGLGSDPDSFFRGSEQSPADKFTVESLRYSFGGERVRRATGSPLQIENSVSIAQASLHACAALHSYGGRSPPPATLA